ncbi:YbaY family lipoprotein [Shewanella sp. Isolate7]|uniref:YbaY family lipoprotein n=1 Tax=Shewanella sp. Isolate7 TaxID=2908528 RepID=UPI001EFC6F9B|nr:YbaY family lipoprotein [Shewanella sp. Isolate7]MCG9720921.1 YbaY family lipoprotein [Shewanella sp. Isolate7]
MNRWLKPLAAVAMSAGLMTACATPNASVEIQGEVWFKERIALPPAAVLSVQIQDVSLMDAPAVVLAAFERDDVTTPAPFTFVIPRDQFEAGHTYSVGAKISLDGKLMFINTQSYPIDLGDSAPISVLVQRVGG